VVSSKAPPSTSQIYGERCACGGILACAPVLDVDWWSVRRPPAVAGDEPGFGATVRVRQRQAGDPFMLDLEVALTLQGAPRIIDTLHITQQGERQPPCHSCLPHKLVRPHTLLVGRGGSGSSP
jgi:hypothetical protein